MRTSSMRMAATMCALLGLVAASCAQLRDLPTLSKADLRFHPAQSSVIYAEDGQPITTMHGVENRTLIRSLSKIPKWVQKAVLAVEDQRFYEHHGVDLKAIIRAAIANATSGRIEEGGSTITQQYVKNAIIAPGETAEQTFRRKIDEAALARQLELKISKHQILKRYLNTVYFGNGAYGLQAAAHLYFGKNAGQLDLAEGAMLAAVIRSPESYDPFRHPAVAKARRDVVLTKMEQLGWAKASNIARAKSSKLHLAPERLKSRYPAPYFVDYVQRLITFDPRFSELGKTWRQRQQQIFNGGLRIYTTVDLDAQADAENAVRSVLPYKTDPYASMVAIDPRNGYVRAMVGGRNYFARSKKDPFAKFNIAIAGEPGLGRVKIAGTKKYANHAPGTGRQAGSAFKPFALAAAIDQGIPLSKTYEARSCMAFPGADAGGTWNVCNFAGESFNGKLSLLEATVHSVNVVYAQVILEVGPSAVVDLAQQMGINTQLQAVPSAVLGANPVNSLDMASAFGTFATNGIHHPPVAITKVTDSRGKVLYEDKSTAERALDPAVSYLTTTALEQVIQRGTGVAANIGRPAAGKTGTGQEYRDAWFVGYTPNLVAAVNLGYPQGEIEMKTSCVGSTEPCRVTRSITPEGVQGGSFPAMIWHAFMAAALAGTPVESFSVPNISVTTVTIDARNGCLANRFTPVEDRVEATFTSGTAPTETCRESGDAVKVPDVFGFPVADAVRVLESEGFSVSRDPQPSTTYPPGRVVGQNPAGGAKAARGSTVVIQVSTSTSSKQAATNTVPSVLGYTEGQAQAALQSHGFGVRVINQREANKNQARRRRGRVWKQSPVSGTRAREGSNVTIWVNPG